MSVVNSPNYGYSASKKNLDVIPLIQTLGHFEWVLKTEEFQHLREVEHWTNVRKTRVTLRKLFRLLASAWMRPEL